MYIYIYIYTHTYKHTYKHTHTHTAGAAAPWSSARSTGRRSSTRARAAIHALERDNWVSTNGVTANFMSFDRGTFWQLPLTYFYLPKSARAYLFPQSVKVYYFCSGPISVDPICQQPNAATRAHHAAAANDESDESCGMGKQNDLAYAVIVSKFSVCVCIYLHSCTWHTRHPNLV